MLRDLNLVSVMDTSSHNFIRDFFVPLLKNSAFYDRGVGFFSSGWLRLTSEGMTNFADNGGRARWITSPILDEADWAALLVGSAARSDLILRNVLEKNIINLAETLEKDTLSALAWMVADEIITFKLALPYDKLERGDFHDKFGIFTDSRGDCVSFNGSYNDSIQGNRNYESIKIFCSWQSAEFNNLVQDDLQRFERLWNNRDPNVKVFALPEAARERILRLRVGERPYKEPDWVKSHRIHESSSAYKIAGPTIPASITLRDYQKEGIHSWFEHQCQGLLEMATGTGKTITALAGSVQLFKREEQLAVIIAVPYQHLVDQWYEDAKAFGYRPILAYKSKTRWLVELNHQVMEYNAGYRQTISIITTHTTFISADFQESITRLKKQVLLIADEVHHLGAEASRWSYPEHIGFRLALSATPDRWFDDEGTAALRAYFGKTIFSFPLEKAIGVSLTPYYYYPYLVPLNEKELEEYQKLSLKIARLVHGEDKHAKTALKMLLIRRAKLLNNAEKKLLVLDELVKMQNRIDHTLFYCAPEQIDEVLRLLGKENGLLVHRFTAEENNKERQQLLIDFADGKLQGLVAMKCLDEGVDVPSTQTAYILASSSNPREFIQRRGRILRKAPDKEFSVIHDLIAVPPTIYNVKRDSPTFDSERSIIRRELLRFKEFANLAQNKHQALEKIWDIAKKYSLMDF